MASPARPSATEVGDQFQMLYYYHLQNHPEVLSQYYKDNSTISRPGLDGTMRASTLPDMIEDLNMVYSGGFDSVVVTSFMSQDSHKGGILVVVAGYVTLNAIPARNFTQSFFLAPQETGYFVFTDIFKFVEANATIPPANNVIEDKVPETEDACIFVTLLPPDATIAWVENAFKQFGEIRRGGTTVIRKRGHKYAIVEFEEADAAQRAIMASPILIDGRSFNVEKKRSYDQSDDNIREPKGVSGIFVKNLPPHATIALVENVFKQFGPIKNGGVRVKNFASVSNYCYGFVDFEEADAAERAIKASPLTIDGHTAHVKKQRYRSESSRDERIVLKAPVLSGLESGHCESPSAGPRNIQGGEEVRGTLGNPYWNWQKMMEEVRGTEVWQKIMMGSRGAEVYDLGNWQKIMDQVDTQVYNSEESQMKFEEEEGRQHNQNRYRSEEVRGTEGVGLEEEEKEENQSWEKKIEEEEGRQYNQNRFRSEQMRETGGVVQIWRKKNQN